MRFGGSMRTSLPPIRGPDVGWIDHWLLPNVHLAVSVVGPLMGLLKS